MSIFALKIIALILMVIDHVGMYFEGIPEPIRILMRLIGRGCYPLFLFCMVWGYHHTRSRKKYLIRLYALSLFMTAFILTIDYFFPTENGIGNHNIFLSMFIVGVLISVIELFQKNRKKGFMALGLIFGVQILYQVIPMFIPMLKQLSGDSLTGIIPNLYLNEYGWEFIALGVLMYFLKERKDLFTVMYIIFCIAQFSTDFFTEGFPFQCFMIISLPLMLKYNNHKGHGMKYFFYIFYPAHVLLLFFLSNFIL